MKRFAVLPVFTIAGLLPFSALAQNKWTNVEPAVYHPEVDHSSRLVRVKDSDDDTSHQNHKSKKKSVERIGAGAVGGALIGGLAGGAKGAAIGGAAGGGAGAAYDHHKKKKDAEK